MGCVTLIPWVIPSLPSLLSCLSSRSARSTMGSVDARRVQEAKGGTHLVCVRGILLRPWCGRGVRVVESGGSCSLRERNEAR